MIGIPLSLVVAFLRPRGALGVLEGAPFLIQRHLHAVQAHDDFSDDSDSLLYGELYLGSGDVCPAAEGWASRVLAIARGVYPASVMVEDDDRVTLWVSGRDEYDYRWGWSEGELEPFEGVEFMLLPGRAPPTPAERLAAVLRYELERAR